MILYFTNNTKQKRKILESDYVEDIYDIIEGFFEEHNLVPRFIKSDFDNGWTITFGSQTEIFWVENYSESDIAAAKAYIMEQIKSLY